MIYEKFEDDRQTMMIDRDPENLKFVCAVFKCPTVARVQRAAMQDQGRTLRDGSRSGYRSCGGCGFQLTTYYDGAGFVEGLIGTQSDKVWPKEALDRLEYILMTAKQGEDLTEVVARFYEGEVKIKEAELTKIQAANLKGTAEKPAIDLNMMGFLGRCQN